MITELKGGQYLFFLYKNCLLNVLSGLGFFKMNTVVMHSLNFSVLYPAEHHNKTIIDLSYLQASL